MKTTHSMSQQVQNKICVLHIPGKAQQHYSKKSFPIQVQRIKKLVTSNIARVSLLREISH